MFDQFKNLAQLGPMMAKAREMQQKMEEVKARVPHLRGTGSAGGGMVTATASGSMEILRLEFSKEALAGDAELLADMTRAAVNQAIRNVQEQVEKQMIDAAGGLDLGALKGMLG